MVRYAAGMAAVITALSVLAAGCGGGDDEGSSDSTTAAAATGGDLFTQTTHTGSLQPISGQDDVFTLTLDQPSPDVTVFTDRPLRSASTESLQGFVSNWDTRGFSQDPPNAALVGVPAIGGAIAGTALQQRIPERSIALLFAGLLVIIAVKLIVS